MRGQGPLAGWGGARCERRVAESEADQHDARAVPSCAHVLHIQGMLIVHVIVSGRPRATVTFWRGTHRDAVLPEAQHARHDGGAARASR